VSGFHVDIEPTRVPLEFESRVLAMIMKWTLMKMKWKECCKEIQNMDE
jgi:hypothetical protein